MVQWKFDPPHCFIEFSVRHWGVSWVKGRFNALSGVATFDENDPERGVAEVEIDTKSISTNNGMRDDHLRSKDFFAVEQFPTATFKSTKVEQTADGKYIVTGDLTIRDITKPVTLAVEYIKPHEVPSLTHQGETEMRVGFTGTTTINRHDFGLNWDMPGVKGGATMVGGEVDLTVGVEAVKQS